MVPLNAAPGLPRSRNLVFTSAGDHSGIAGWLEGERDFDLCVVYYGETPGRHAEIADYYVERKGAKFPNLHHVWRQHPELLAAYEAVWVADDDLRIDATAISRLFALRRERDLWLLQPGIHPRGRVNHRITRARGLSRLRFTSFVEVTAPLFRRDKLEAFLGAYDPVLVGWGVDWWFLESLGSGSEGRVAIADSIPCTNPAVRGDGRREIDRIASRAEREQCWRRLAARRGLVGEARGKRVEGREWLGWREIGWRQALGLAIHGAARDVRGLGRTLPRRARRLRDRLGRGLVAPGSAAR